MGLEQFRQYVLDLLHRAGWQIEPLLAADDGGQDWALRWPSPYLRVGARFAPLYSGWGVSIHRVAVTLHGVGHWEWLQPGDEEAQEVLVALTTWRLRKAMPMWSTPEEVMESARTPEDVFAVLAQRLTERQYRLFACVCL